MSSHTCTPSGWDDCRRCWAGIEATEMAAGAFATIVCLTVVPIVPLLLYTVHAMWGMPGFWAALVFFYAGLPVLAGAATFVAVEREQP